MHPKNTLVRLVDWQLKKLLWYLLIPASLIAAISKAADFIGVFYFAQTPELQTPYYAHEATRLQGMQEPTFDNNLRLIVTELRGVNAKLQKLVDAGDGNSSSTNLDNVEGNLTLIALELQDLNCAVHKCEDFSDENDPASILLEVLEAFDNFENVTGYLDQLNDVLVKDNDCVHPYGAAILSPNVYSSCIYEGNSFKERDVNFCDSDTCYQADWAISNGPFYSHYCGDHKTFGIDLVAYQPAYYFKKVLATNRYNFEYLLKLPENVATSYAIFVVEAERCYIRQGTDINYSLTCEPTTSSLGYYLPLPQEVSRSETRCIKYNTEDLVADYWDCGLETSVDAELRRLSHMLNGQSYFPNATLNIRDQNLIIPSINYIFDSYTDATFPYIRPSGFVNVSYPLDTEISLPAKPICFNLKYLDSEA